MKCFKNKESREFYFGQGPEAFFIFVKNSSGRTGYAPALFLSLYQVPWCLGLLIRTRSIFI